MKARVHRLRSGRHHPNIGITWADGRPSYEKRRVFTLRFSRTYQQWQFTPGQFAAGELPTNAAVGPTVRGTGPIVASADRPDVFDQSNCNVDLVHEENFI